MTDFSTLAQRMYGTPDAAPEAAPEATPAPAAQPGPAPAAQPDPLSGFRAPQEIVDQRAADVASRLYADSDGWADGIEPIAQQLARQAKLSPEQASEAAGELVQTYRDMGLSAAEARAVAEGAVRPANAAERAALHDSIIQAINNAHGDNASAMVRLAQKFVKADPRRAALVDALGDSPAAALLIIEKARAAAARGRK